MQSCLAMAVGQTGLPRLGLVLHVQADRVADAAVAAVEGAAAVGTVAAAAVAAAVVAAVAEAAAAEVAKLAESYWSEQGRGVDL